MECDAYPKMKGVDSSCGIDFPFPGNAWLKAEVLIKPHKRIKKLPGHGSF